jgi:DNA-binding CsgD family transcriptional regulator
MPTPAWSDPDRRDAALERVAAAVAAPTTLTKQQLAMVFLLSHGRTIMESASVLTISEWTARTYAKEARERLQARSNAHAVATALRLGLIS